MKLLILALLISSVAYGQSTYYIRADSIRFQKVGGNTTFILENATRAKTGAYLRNYSNGRTDFYYAVDSASVSGSNLILWRGGGSQNITVGITGSGTAWNLLGNASTVAGTNFVGTTDAVGLSIKTNSLERIQILSGGNVGIGAASASASVRFRVPDNTSIGNGYVGEFTSTVLTSGNILKVTGQSTFLTTNNRGFHVDITGANANSGVNAMAANLSVGNTGTSSTNTALRLEAHSADNNVALDISTGSITLGTNTNYGIAGQVLTSGGINAVPTWETPGGGITGSGTTNYIPKFTGASSIGNSDLFNDGGSVRVYNQAELSFYADAGITRLGGVDFNTANSFNWRNAAGTLNLRHDFSALLGSDKTATWRNLSGTVAYLSDITSGLTVGTTAIASGTNTRILYDNSGVVGEYTLTGTGTVVAMQTSPTFNTSVVVNNNTADGSAFMVSDANRTLAGTAQTTAVKILGTATPLNNLLHMDNNSATARAGFVLSNSASSSDWANNHGGMLINGASFASNYYMTNISGKSTDAGYTYLFNQGSATTGFGVMSVDNIPLYLGTNNTMRIAVSGAGAVQFATYTAGTATFDGSGNITSVSDRRAKNNINPFKYGLKEILGLKTSTFIYNQDNSNTVMSGFIAQDVASVMPSAVHSKDGGMLSLETNAIIAALVNGMQEQQKQIQDLKKEIIKLKRK